MKSTVPVGTGPHDPPRRAPSSPTSPAPSSSGRARRSRTSWTRTGCVIGADPGDEWAADAVAAVYEPLGAPIVRTDVASAEMIKLASNAFLATKISFINEIANVCEEVGADVDRGGPGDGPRRRASARVPAGGDRLRRVLLPQGCLGAEAARRQLGLPLPAAELGDRGQRAAEAPGDGEARRSTSARWSGSGWRCSAWPSSRTPTTCGSASSLVLASRLAGRGRRGRRLRPGRPAVRARAAAGGRDGRQRRWTRWMAPTPPCWSPSGRSSPELDWAEVASG